MNVGILLIFQNYQGRGSDADMVRDQIRIADLAEPLGFDALWPPEHHFTDYSACPDNLQFLSYMAAKTERIQLGTGAVIVPWNDPLRVVEKVAFLDHLSNGRAVLGLGRGLARVEYQKKRKPKKDKIGNIQKNLRKLRLHKNRLNRRLNHKHRHQKMITLC
jgi:alkanesulfonate monooxygenase SsuD/methylene tetrahydromethanopterin reductase-like flavin-dependent oxidoreductase (luciferase family)